LSAAGGLLGNTARIELFRTPLASISDTSRVVSVSRIASSFLGRTAIAFLDAQEKPVARGQRKSPQLKTGWYGVGNPFNASIPNTAAAAAHKIVNSKVIGMNAGQLLSGLPPNIYGIADQPRRSTGERSPHIRQRSRRTEDQRKPACGGRPIAFRQAFNRETARTRRCGGIPHSACGVPRRGAARGC